MASSHDIVSHPFTITLIQRKASQLVRRRDFSPSDREELEQGMRLYILERANQFDATRGNLEAFVNNLVKTWVGQHLRFRKREMRSESYRAVSLERTPVEFEGEITSLGSMLLEEDGRRMTKADPATSVEALERKEAIAHVLHKLAPEDRDFLISMVEKGITVTTEALGISWRQAVNRMALLRRDFEKAGLGAGDRGAASSAA